MLLQIAHLRYAKVFAGFSVRSLQLPTARKPESQGYHIFSNRRIVNSMKMITHRRMPAYCAAPCAKLNTVQSRAVVVVPSRRVSQHRHLSRVRAAQPEVGYRHAENSAAEISGRQAEEPSISSEERRKFVLEEARTFLESDLQRLFNSGEITRARYSPTIRFEDPITAYNNLDGYVFNITLLRTLFNITFKLHTMEITGSDEITARWTMGMEMWLLPWKPNLMFTGRTFYKVDEATGMILSHVDVWDALEHNKFLSLEGVQHVLRMFMQIQLTPSIETPKYTVLKKFKDYEIREYPSYLVAETAQPSGSGPASGSGFNELAGYIFGGNRENMKMEMTTPVLSTVAPEGNQSTRMQFVMGTGFRDVNQLPSPVDSKVFKKEEKGGFFAAISFNGWPLDFEVVQNERALRDYLLRDGLQPAPGYTLARYNDPATLPAVRRNEVLIELPSFQWPPVDPSY